MEERNARIICADEELILSPYKAAYWHKMHTLILADLHLGKSSYFRKNGIAVPATVMLDDLQRLEQLITEFNPQQILIVGDMFHHEINSDVMAFGNWRKSYSELQISLVVGNHDKLLAIDYANLQVTVLPQRYEKAPFVFIHEYINQTKEFTISGHLHPGVSIAGKAKQSLRLPCFTQGARYLILPAFSSFTGLNTNFENLSGHKNYAIGGNKIFSI